MAQILTYPHGIKYQSSGWANQVKQGTGGSIPCNNELYEGKSVVTTNGEQWWGDNTGNTTYSWTSANNHPFNQNWNSSDKGLHYWVQTSSNGFRKARWFDIGAEGGKNHGATMSSGARSSWLREVTALWFLVNGHDTTQTRGCYAHIEKAALRYRDPNGKIAIHKLTQKLGNLYVEESGNWGGVRGPNKEMFGYALPSSLRSTICNNNYRFLGIRVQLLLRRDSSGTSTDTIQCGINGIRLGLGTSPTGSYNTTNKRALVLAGNTTWNDFSNSSIKDRLETR
jgi:hypothetical protein